MKAILILLLITIIGCKLADCDRINNLSHKEALRIVKLSRFPIKESINTSKSSWIKKASFYSCDGKTGFFVLKTKSKEYIYKGMPIEIWKEFIATNSFGEYYNKYIKGRYLYNTKN